MKEEIFCDNSTDTIYGNYQQIKRNENIWKKKKKVIKEAYTKRTTNQIEQELIKQNGIL